MKLKELGLTDDVAEQIRDLDQSGFTAGRVTQENRERYVVSDGEKEYDAEITGNLRFSAASRADFPAVGDWVVMKVYDQEQSIIHRVLPRKSALVRKSAGKTGDIQIISSNIDVAFIVQAINNNFNINRLERYIIICHDSGIEPVLVISKTDLVSPEELQNAEKALEQRGKLLRRIKLSNVTHDGLDQVMDVIEKGKTYCVIGSSGVGKSTLINNLLKKNILKTGQISSHTNKGRHISDHRELFILENGGIIIDTPGMKQLGLTEDSGGIQSAFADIAELSEQCRFSGCTHTAEAGCAVLEAVSAGKLDNDTYENYLRIRKEQERFRITAAEKHKKDRIFGKMLKNYYRDMKNNSE